MLDNGVFVTEIENNIKPRIENPSPLDVNRQHKVDKIESKLVECFHH
jgi:hypothetical protein